MEFGQKNQTRLEVCRIMSVDSKANAGTTAIRELHRFDEARLADWMADNIADYSGPLTVEQFKGGQSNPTYKLITPSRTYVLRRKPPGPLLKGAHAVEREATVLSALAQSNVPVAHIYGLCTDNSIIGSWFYIMAMVEGRIFWDATFPSVERSERWRYFEAMNTTIAELHKIKPEAVGLGEFGRPGNYFERQISRWSKQYLADEEAGRDAGMDRLVEWLPRNIPAGDETSIVHGDFRCDNMIFHPSEPRILAVLDWELSTLGHPLADFAYHAMMYQTPPNVVAGLAGADLNALGIPTEREYVEQYCKNVGRSAIPEADYAFYIAFNFFRLAAIFHGIKGRVIRGTAASEHAKERAKSFPKLVVLALEAMKRCQ